MTTNVEVFFFNHSHIKCQSLNKPVFLCPFAAWRVLLWVAMLLALVKEYFLLILFHHKIFHIGKYKLMAHLHTGLPLKTMQPPPFLHSDIML